MIFPPIVSAQENNHALLTSLIKSYYRVGNSWDTPPPLPCPRSKLSKADISLSIRHKIWPALSALSECNFEREAYAALTQYHASYRKHRVKLQLTLASLGEELQRHKVEVLLLKGDAFQRDLYRDRVRPFTDIDLLVPERHTVVVGSLFRELGFRQSGSVLIAPDGIEVDMHGAFPGVYSDNFLTFEEVWKQRKLLYSGLFTLPAKLQLVVALLHGAKHRWSKLIYLVDLVLTYERSENEHGSSEVQKYLSQLGLLRSFNVAANLAQDVFEDRSLFRGIGQGSMMSRVVATWLRKRLFVKVKNSLFQRSIGIPVTIYLSHRGSGVIRYSLNRVCRSFKTRRAGLI